MIQEDPMTALKPLPVAVSAICALLYLMAADARAQCSDAGACAISRHAGDEPAAHSHTVGVRYQYGSSGSPDDVKYHAVSVEANLQPFSESRLMLTLPFHSQSGPLGSVSGMGDLIAVWEQTVLRWGETENRLRIQAGARLATGNANAEPSLPMTYQPGLGSNDLILGASAGLSRWTAGAAYQLAGKRNNNALVRLERGDQILVWGNYELPLDKTTFSPGVTIIKQLQESSVLESAASTEAFVSVPGSDQLQVNLALRVRHEFSPQLGAELFAAIPLRPRDVNVDGLKRSMVLSIGMFLAL